MKSRRFATPSLLLALFCVAATASSSTVVEVYTTSTSAGLPGVSGSSDGSGSSVRFYYPFSIAIDGNGNTYIADTGSHTIRKVTNGQVTTLAGSASFAGSANGSGSAARFRLPYGIAADSAGTVFVADTDNHTVRKITPGGVVSTYAGIPGSSGSNDGAAATAFQ